MDAVLTVITSLLFSASVWLIFHSAVKKAQAPLKFSLIAALVLAGWFAAMIIFSQAGFFAINPLVAPNIFIGFIILFALFQKVYSFSRLQPVWDALSITWAAAVQTQRVFGIYFFNLYSLGLLPAAFAFPSGAGDVLIGITAPIVAYCYAMKKPYSRKLAIVWNILGIADLVMAVSLGVLGFPRPLQVLPVTPSTEIFALFPMAFIPLFAIPLALLLHYVSLRTLMKSR